jgi:H-type lectin domain
MILNTKASASPGPLPFFWPFAQRLGKIGTGSDVRFGMQRFSGRIGLEQGNKILFSDFAHDGAMWTGSGPREVRQPQCFRQPFKTPPAVTVGISMWDIDHKTNSRIDISAENITALGFEIVFRTWGDTRIARIRADWLAVGETRDDDDWEVL